MKHNHKESLERLHNSDLLNYNGLKEYIRLLKQEISELKCKIIDLEHELSYKK